MVRGGSLPKACWGELGYSLGTGMATTEVQINMQQNITNFDSKYSNLKQFNLTLFLVNSFMIINCMIGPIGIVCNLLSIVVLVQKSLRNVFHDLLLSLACFDLFYLFLRLCLVVAVYRRHR